MVPAADLAKYDAIFEVAKGADGKICGAKAAAVLNRSGLPRETLRAVWSLVDVCNAGKIDREWFALAMHLAARARRGKPLPHSPIYTASLGAGSCFAAQGVLRCQEVRLNGLSAASRPNTQIY